VSDLFAHAAEADTSSMPLAERMRPKRLADVVGQDHLVGAQGFLSKAIRGGRPPSLILWGPPGSGKTTIAEAIAKETLARFVKLSAVSSGIKDIRDVVEEAKRARDHHRMQTVLFVDEIHRWNKSQQDALLPHVEKGTVTIIGATTENPSFEVNAALLSRCRVLVTKAVDAASLAALIDRALQAPHGLLDRSVSIDEVAKRMLVAAAQGDARRALTGLEVACDVAMSDGRTRIEAHDVETAVQRRVLLYDKGGEEHYGVVSAFIKSMRGGDPDAALHYLVRMLESGEEPTFILRRMVIFASEDIGNADPQALVVATSAVQAFSLVGLPEGALALSQVVTYLACAPKSNASYVAYKAARADVVTHGALPVPMHLKNAATSLQQQLGYGANYKYPHDHEGALGAVYLPDSIAHQKYYNPTENGDEKRAYLHVQRLRAARVQKP
jgi:putative ATPase